MKALLASALALVASGTALAEFPMNRPVPQTPNPGKVAPAKLKTAQVQTFTALAPVVRVSIKEIPGMSFLTTYGIFALAVYDNGCKVPESDAFVATDLPEQKTADGKVVQQLVLHTLQ